MNILCPGCQTSIPSSEQDPRATCGGCGLEIDLSQVGTFPGIATMSLVRDLAGESLGQYEVLELVGMGGMGVVYRARDLDNGSIVALKVLYCDPLKKADFVARFEREARTLLKLDNPHIVKILASGEQEGIYYLVTELLHGETLAQYLKSHNPPLKETIRIMTQVCSAIAHAHNQGIIHRDIKPANIILDDGSVKVLDFGLSHLTGGESQFSTLTRSDLAMGSFNYLSPEQRMNAKAVDQRADIFSLGVIFYEMLTGSLPLGNFVPPSKTGHGIPAKCDRIVSRALHVDPDQRYQKVEDFAEALHRIDKTKRVRKKVLIPVFTALALAATLLAFGPDVSLTPDKTRGKILTGGKEESVKPGLKPKAPKKSDVPPTAELAIEPEKAAQTKRILPEKKSSKKSFTSKALQTEKPYAALPRVTLYKNPSEKSPVIEKRAVIGRYEVIRTEQADGKRPKWLFIRTPDGRRGWIRGPVK